MKLLARYLKPFVGILLVCLVLPAVISWAVCILMRRAGLIAEGDLKLKD